MTTGGIDAGAPADHGTARGGISHAKGHIGIQARDCRRRTLAAAKRDLAREIVQDEECRLIPPQLCIMPPPPSSFVHELFSGRGRLKDLMGLGRPRGDHPPYLSPWTGNPPSRVSNLPPGISGIHRPNLAARRGSKGSVSPSSCAQGNPLPTTRLLRSRRGPSSSSDAGGPCKNQFSVERPPSKSSGARASTLSPWPPSSPPAIGHRTRSRSRVPEGSPAHRASGVR